MVYSLNFRISGNKLLFKLLCLFIALNLSSAHADEFDTFNVVVGSNYTHDSNVFKLPSGVQPAASGAERSDNILRNSVGFRLDKKYSLQVFKVTFDHVDTRYDNAKFLDFKGNNYSAAWLWAITPYLNGVLSADRTVSLIPFQDLRSGNATSPSQNIRTSETQLFNFDYSPFSNWHLLGALNKLSIENSRTFLPETSFELDSVEGGIKYVFPSQSFIKWISRVSDGQNQSTNPARLVGKEFEEKQQEISSLWIITGKSRIVSNIGHISRDDSSFSVRDFSGMFGGVSYSWDISGKTNITFGVSRRISAFQTDVDSYSVRDVFMINPSWAATSKITVKSNLQIGRRSFEGEGPLLSATSRTDNLLSYGLAVDWTPRSNMNFGLNLQRDERDSNQSNFDYTANILSANGRLSF